jgi:hypothetical protein
VRLEDKLELAFELMPQFYIINSSKNGNLLAQSLDDGLIHGGL